MPTATGSYSFSLPIVGSDANTWGTSLNANWEALDELLDGTELVTGMRLTGGIINGTPIGQTTAAAARFTSCAFTTSVHSGNASSSLNLAGGTAGDGATIVLSGSTAAAADALAISASTVTFTNESATDLVTLTTDGYLGIGETSPGQRLVVSKDGADVTLSGVSSDAAAVLHPGNGTSSDGAALDIVANATGVAAVNFGSPTDGELGRIAYSNDTDSLLFDANGTEVARMLSDGTVLIGKVTRDLTLEGVILEPNGQVSATTDGSGTAGVFNREDTDGTLLSFRRNNGGVGSITVTATATSYNTASDERRKNNIKSADSRRGNSVVDRLKVREFNWNDTDEKEEFGLVAQEVHEAYPRAVTQSPDTDELFVDYSKLVPLLLSEVKDLRRRVANLEQRGSRAK